MLSRKSIRGARWRTRKNPYNLRSEERSKIGVDKEDQNLRYYYDGDNQLVKSVIEGKATQYAYDAAGNMVADGENTYTYNKQNQLLTKAGEDGTTKYSYDAAGNLIKKEGPEGSTAYSYNSQGKLVRGENSDGSYSEYTYNAMGVRIGNTQYRRNKNAAHANAEPDHGSSHIKNYLPALSDERADWQPTWESEVGSVHQNDFETVTTHYTVDYLSEKNNDLLAEVDGAYTARYVYTTDELRVSAEFTYAEGTERGKASAAGEYGENPASDFSARDISKVWYRTNITGSNLYVVDETGETVSHVIYDIWGECLTETGIDINFTGLEGISSFTNYGWDETLKLYFSQNRFYDPALHRFIQTDITEDGSNWYIYTENNPLLRIDPDGFAYKNATGGYSSKAKTSLSTGLKKITGVAKKAAFPAKPKASTAAKPAVKKPAVTKAVNSVAKGIAKVPAVTRPQVQTVAKSIAAGAVASIITAKQTTPIVNLKAQNEAVKAAEAAKQAAAIAKGKEYAKKAAERTAGLLSDLSKVQCNPSENNTGFTSNNALEKGANTLACL